MQVKYQLQLSNCQPFRIEIALLLFVSVTDFLLQLKNNINPSNKIKDFFLVQIKNLCLLTGTCIYLFTINFIFL